MKNISNENIVCLYDSIEGNNNYYFVLENLPNETLQDKINKYKSKFNSNNITPIKESIILNYFKQIVNGLEYLHNLNIIHRDINFSAFSWNNTGTYVKGLF